MTLAKHLQIDREDERAAFGCGRTLDERTNEATVLHHIELEPERLAHGLRDILDRADRHGRESERDSGRMCGAASENLAVSLLHPAKPNGSKRNRKPRRLANDRRGEIALRYVNQYALAQLDPIEVLPIGAQRGLRIGAGLSISEECARHLAARNLPQILDAGHRAQRHYSSPFYGASLFSTA